MRSRFARAGFPSKYGTRHAPCRAEYSESNAPRPASSIAPRRNSAARRCVSAFSISTVRRAHIARLAECGRISPSNSGKCCRASFRVGKSPPFRRRSICSTLSLPCFRAPGSRVGIRSIAAMASPGAARGSRSCWLLRCCGTTTCVRGPAHNEHTSLCLFLGEDAGALTAHRLRWLTSETLRPRLFRFNAHGSAGEVDPRDLGNLDTRVAARYAPPRLTPDLEALLARLERIEDAGWCPELTGAISIRSRGWEFARIEARPSPAGARNETRSSRMPH